MVPYFCPSVSDTSFFSTHHESEILLRTESFKLPQAQPQPIDVLNWFRSSPAYQSALARRDQQAQPIASETEAETPKLTSATSRFDRILHEVTANRSDRHVLLQPEEVRMRRLELDQFRLPVQLRVSHGGDMRHETRQRNRVHTHTVPTLRED